MGNAIFRGDLSGMVDHTLNRQFDVSHRSIYCDLRMGAYSDLRPLAHVSWNAQP